MRRSVNAIERLRAACYLGGDLPSVAQVEDDLAAVDALYQAARAVVASDGTGRKRIDALAAAVRRMSGRDANQPMPQYGIDRDYPLLCEKARQYDFAERLGGCSDPLMAEIDAALRELWDARRCVMEEASRA